MACDKFSDSIGALIDGSLDPAGRRALDEHLGSCSACRTLAADLRRIHREAARLPRMTPPGTLWMKVRERLEAEMKTRPATVPAMPSPSATLRAGAPDKSGAVAGDAVPASPGWREALAAWWRPLVASPLRSAFTSALVIVLALGAGYAVFRQSGPGPAPEGGVQGQPAAADNAQGQDLVESVETELRLAEQHYEKAIAGLEQIAKAEQASLDPQVALVLQKNLGIIDEAIRESRVALQSQPTNQVAQASLFEAFRRKVALLQDTIALINEMRKGDQAGAARVLQNLNRG